MIPWLALAATVAQAGQVRHALVVGANDGGGVLGALKYAENDAQRVAEVLVDLGEFDEQFVTVLYRPSNETLRTALAHHAAIAEDYDDDLFLFYYSGHADGVGLRLGDDRYFFETLQHDLRAIDSDVRLGVLDACRSGTITRLKGAVVTESLFGTDDSAIEGEAWLTASASDEQAQESESLRGGFFTHYLVSGMRGAADYDDGVVSLEELYSYTYDRVVDATGRTGSGTQHPRFDYRMSGAGELGLTDLRHADALLTLRAEDEGQIGVFRLPDKMQLAEFYKDNDRAMAIAVPPGSYLVRRRSEDVTYEARFGLREGMKVELADWGRPVLEFGIARGDARVTELVASSQDYERQLNLSASPVVAGSASLVLPGAGQFYNRQGWKGATYLAVTATLLAGVILNPTQEELGNGFWPTLGAGMWGASVADASYNVHRHEGHRPRLGGTISWSGAFQSTNPWPAHYGLSADVMIREGLSLGLDRIGYTPGPDGQFDAHLGSRIMIAVEGERWRPHAVAGIGIRYGRLAGIDSRSTRTVVSAGGGLRYYVVPRYFLELEARYQRDGNHAGIASGVGMGVHLGR